VCVSVCLCELSGVCLCMSVCSICVCMFVCVVYVSVCDVVVCVSVCVSYVYVCVCEWCVCIYIGCCAQDYVSNREEFLSGFRTCN